MELSTITPSNRDYEIKDPRTGEPTGLVFTLRPDSAKEVKDYERAWTNQQIRRGRGKSLTAEQIEARNIGRIVASVEGWAWNGEAQWEGAKPEFSEAMLRKVLTKVDWIRKDLDDELGNDTAFFQS